MGYCVLSVQIMSDGPDTKMDVDIDRKRKQEGSSGVSPSLKKQVSLGDLRGACELNWDGSPESNPVLGTVVSAFQDKTFIKQITPSLKEIFQPLMNQAIEQAVTNTATRLERDVIKPLQEQNKLLRQRVKENETMIQFKDEVISKQEQQIKTLEHSVETLGNQLDDLEQYGRRTSVRLHNVPPDFGLNTDVAAVRVFNDLMNVAISIDDIERSHPLGKEKDNGTRPIIVKFKTYKSKEMVYKAKSGLKGNPHKIFMTEDLTQKNYKIALKLLQLRSDKRIDSFWTHDGKIFFKDNDVSKPVRVRNMNELGVTFPPPQNENTIPKA